MRWDKLIAAVIGFGFAFAAGSAALGQAQKTLDTTSTPAVGEFPITTLDFPALADADQWTVADVSFGTDGVGSLALMRFDVFDDQSRIVVVEDGVERELPRPQVALFTGQVVGRPDSSAYLSVSPFGVYGYVLTAGRQFVISSGPAESGLPTLMFDPAGVPTDFLNIHPYVCGTDSSTFAPRAPYQPQEGTAGGPPCRYARVAVDTDYEFLANPFGGNQSAATAYVATLFGAVSQIYARDVNTRIYVSYLRLWANSNDPWTGSDTPSQLDQFRIYWNDNMTSEFRHVTHMLSARGLGGGIAYIDALCHFSIRYAVSANLAGYFPYPIQNNNSQNWDLMVVAHELGHNFGAPHTHDMGIDYCAYGDCSVTPNGTIMSYCHLCPGGMTNVRMEFHPRTINETILPYLESDAPCNLEVVTPIFTMQPTGANPLCGQSLVLHSEAVTLGPIAYQWRLNGIPLTDGPQVSGATTATLTLSNVSEADSGNYTLAATSICDQTATSSVAVINAHCVTRGDCNCDGVIDNFDLDPFVLALTNPLGYGVDFPTCDPSTADIDGDGVVSNFDIDPFINCLISAGCQ